MTIPFYIFRRFIAATLQVQAVVLLLAGLLTLVEKMRVASNLGRPAEDAVRLTLLQMPDTLSQAFPLVMMLSALVTFLGFSRSSELVVFRASGVSGIRVIVVPFLTALAFGVLAVTVFNPIIAATTIRGEALLDSFRQGRQNVLSFSKDALWLRQGTDSGQMVIQASRVSASGTTLFDVRLHEFNEDGRMTSRLEAANASLTGGEWKLRNVTSWSLDIEAGLPLAPPAGFDELRVPTDLTSDQILESFSPPNTISFWRLPQFIAQLEAAGFSSLRHRLFFQIELARPAFFAAMVLIGAGFSLRHIRFGQIGVMIFLAIFAGFGLYFFKDLAESLGQSGAIPVILAAWSPPAIAILLAVGFLLHVEDG